MKLSTMSKKQLRARCDKLGIVWDKQADDEESLRKKIRNTKEVAETPKKSRVHIEDEGGEEGEDTGPDKSIAGEWNLRKRAETDEIVDKKTGKKRIRPVDCFGWLHEDGNNECSICPHAKPCSKLSADADLNLLADDVHQEAKKPEPVEKAEPKTEKPEKGKLSEGSVVNTNFDKTILKKVDEDLRPFYKVLYKKFSEQTITVRRVIDTFGDYFEVEDRGQILTDLVQVMVDNKELTIVKF